MMHGQNHIRFVISNVGFGTKWPWHILCCSSVIWPHIQREYTENFFENTRICVEIRDECEPTAHLDSCSCTILVAACYII